MMMLNAKCVVASTAPTLKTARRPGLAVMVTGVGAGSTIGVRAISGSPVSARTSCATPARRRNSL